LVGASATVQLHEGPESRLPVWQARSLGPLRRAGSRPRRRPIGDRTDYGSRV